MTDDMVKKRVLNNLCNTKKKDMAILMVGSSEGFEDFANHYLILPN